MAFSSRLTLSLILLLLAVCHGHAAPRAAPAPAVDCSSLILNMADCLSYVSNDSKTEKPEGSCCTGLKTVLKADASCLCEAFKSTGQMGIVLNMTKAMALPAACKVSAPSAANCGLAVAPAGAPVATLSPQNTPTTSSAAAPESSAAAPESSAAGGNVVAPAAAPASSACAMLFSSVTLLLGLSAASLPYF